jgi:hypothetical protein
MTKPPNADVEQHRHLRAEPPAPVMMIPNRLRAIDLAQAEGALPPGCDASDRGPLRSDGFIPSELTAAMENQPKFAAHQLMLTDALLMRFVVHPERAR